MQITFICKTVTVGTNNIILQLVPLYVHHCTKWNFVEQSYSQQSGELLIKLMHAPKPKRNNIDVYSNIFSILKVDKIYQIFLTALQQCGQIRNPWDSIKGCLAIKCQKANPPADLFQIYCCSSNGHKNILLACVVLTWLREIY